MRCCRVIRHAGASSMGRIIPRSLGDYCAGPNHVLPTSGTARFFVTAACTTFRSAPR